QHHFEELAHLFAAKGRPGLPFCSFGFTFRSTFCSFSSLALFGLTFGNFGAQPMPLKQPPEVGAIETEDARSFRNRAHALYHGTEVRAVEVSRREPLGLGERHRHKGFVVKRDWRGGGGSGLFHEGDLSGGKAQLLHALGITRPVPAGTEA